MLGKPTTLKYDYSGLNADDTLFARNAAFQIKSVSRRIVQDAVTVGNTLAQCRERLGYGRYGEWLKVEFGMSQDTAERLINLSKSVSTIPHYAEIGLSALYELTAPSTPQVVVEQVNKSISLGHKPTTAQIKTLKSTHKTKQLPAPMLPKLLPANVPAPVQSIAPVELPDGIERRLTTLVEQLDEYYSDRPIPIDDICSRLRQLAIGHMWT